MHKPQSQVILSLLLSASMMGLSASGDDKPREIKQKVEHRIIQFRQGPAADKSSKQTAEQISKLLKEAGVSDKDIEDVVEKIQTAIGQPRFRIDVNKFGGKAIVVGPDGSRREIELGLAKPERIVRAMVLKKDNYIIGVDCETAGDVLRSQLDLGQGVGLVVKSVFDGMPAKEAGVKTHDVLIRAGGKQLAQVSDLMAAVEAAGQEKKKLSLTLIRGGKEKKVEVAPTRRKFTSSSKARFESRVWVDKVGPGVITRKLTLTSAEDTLEKQVKQLARELKELKEQVERLQKD